MDNEANINSLMNGLVLWIQRINLDNKRWCLTNLKYLLVQQKIKKIPKYNSDSSAGNSNLSRLSTPINKNYLQNASTNYVSINDFKPIQDNYSSIKILTDESNSSSYQSNNFNLLNKYSSTISNLSNFKSIGHSNDNPHTKHSKKIQFLHKKNHHFDKEDHVDKQTFLENWMIRQQIEFFLFEEFPKSSYCFKKIRSYHQQALDSIKKYSFQSFCKRNIKPEGFWVFKTFDRLKYSKDLLTDSMIYLSQTQTQKALQIYEHLLKAGGDLESRRHYIYHIYRILQILQSESDDLIEQTYLQLIKQFDSKKIIYMQILCVFSCCLKPSARLYLPLLDYLVEENLTIQTNGITQEHYNYCFYHFIKNFDEPRKSLPSLYEINCFMHLKRIPITICFPKQKIFYLEAYTKVPQLIEQIVNFYDLDQHIQYLLMINGVFLESGILFDKLNCYENRNIQKKLNQYESFKTFRALIVLKNMNQYKKSKRCFNIMCNYYVSQYIKGLFPLKQKQLIEVAALIMCSQMYDEENYNFDFKRLVSARVRIKIQKPQEKKKYKNYILDAYFKFHGTKIQARKKIIQILSKSKGYMTHFFKCAVFFDQLEQFDNWVGVKKNKFVFINPENGRFIRQIYYAKIYQWGASKSQLCIKVDSLGVIHIDTLQTEVLTSIFSNYLQYIYTESQCLLSKKQIIGK